MRPKLREIEAHPIVHQGQAMLLLRDPLRLSSSTLAIPRQLAPLLGLMDGTREEEALEAALRVRTGVRLAPGLLESLLLDLDQALLLDNDRFAEGKASALRDYREASARQMTLGGASFPMDPDTATAHLQRYLEDLGPTDEPAQEQPVRGLVSPHIDYQRGGPVYAAVWRAAAPAARDAELVVLLGTDHQAADAALTPTLQSYSTPWGVLPTDTQVVGLIADALGSESAFAAELHHVGEHSIELAAVWLHFVRGGEPVPVVPILCGSFSGFIEGLGDPAAHEPFQAVLDLLCQTMLSRRTLVVAAADLAHMGPAFGDAFGLDFVARAQLRMADERLLANVNAGDPMGFFAELEAERDRRHVCGLPPIYLTLRLLGDTAGETVGYDICPADPEGLSFVSIAGVVLR